MMNYKKGKKMFKQYCDFCGKQVSQFPIVVVPEELQLRTISITLNNILKNKSYDCCPACFEEKKQQIDKIMLVKQ